MRQRKVTLPFNVEYYLRATKFCNWVLNNSCVTLKWRVARRMKLRPLETPMQKQNNSAYAQHDYPAMQ